MLYNLFSFLFKVSTQKQKNIISKNNNKNIISKIIGVNYVLAYMYCSLK